MGEITEVTNITVSRFLLFYGKHVSSENIAAVTAAYPSLSGTGYPNEWNSLCKYMKNSGSWNDLA